jgi:hypothetical protein
MMDHGFFYASSPNLINNNNKRLTQIILRCQEGAVVANQFHVGVVVVLDGRFRVCGCLFSNYQSALAAWRFV